MVRILNFHPADWGSNIHFIFHLSFLISLINLFKISHISSNTQIYSDIVRAFCWFKVKISYSGPSKISDCCILSTIQQSIRVYLISRALCTLIILVLLFVYWDWLWFYLPKFCFSIDFFSSTVFECTKDADCNNRGFCNNGECLCSPGWDEVDCSSK